MLSGAFKFGETYLHLLLCVSATQTSFQGIKRDKIRESGPIRLEAPRASPVQKEIFG